MGKYSETWARHEALRAESERQGVTKKRVTEIDGELANAQALLASIEPEDDADREAHNQFEEAQASAEAVRITKANVTVDAKRGDVMKEIDGVVRRRT